MVLGELDPQGHAVRRRRDYSLLSNGDLTEQLREAIGRLPEGAVMPLSYTRRIFRKRSTPLPPLERHITEGSFFVGDDKTLLQVQNGEAMPVTYGEQALEGGRHDDGQAPGRADCAYATKRAASCNRRTRAGPMPPQRDARRKASIAPMTASPASTARSTKPPSARNDGTTIRRMPNLVKFRSDPTPCW